MWYLNGFVKEVVTGGTRNDLALQLAFPTKYENRKLAVYAEPAPYCQPPVDLFATEWWLLPPAQEARANDVSVRVLDEGTRISWANKQFDVHVPQRSKPILRVKGN
jgi:hypothetical protein